MPRQSLTLLTFLAAWLLCTAAHAHFLWLVAEAPHKNWQDSSQNKPGSLNICFSESATPDDPDLLERVKHATVWYRQKDGTVTNTSFEKVDDALHATIEQPFDVAGVSCTYGVLDRQGETFLLQYAAKSYTQAAPIHWKPVSNSEILPLELHPLRVGEVLVITATWQGQPTADVVIRVSGPDLDKFEATTNEKGQVQLTPPLSGLLSIRGKHIEPLNGEYNGKSFQSVRHYSTLTLNYNVKHLAQLLPPVSAPITSFGGAVVDGAVYAYGGNTGNAHRYVPEEQSGTLYKLTNPHANHWEEVSTGPRRTGLALIPYHNTVIRIGGFDVRNAPDEDKNLRSTTDVSAFDTKTATWTDLPPLPQGRSSFDAAVIDDTLYVVGGWCMKGRGEAVAWHNTMLTLDLSNPRSGWQTTPQPFQRRAIAVAAVGSQLFVVGGMTSDDETTSAVEIFDTKTKAWSTGPALPSAHKMDGFGTSAIAFENHLYATTMSGQLHRLSPGTLAWEHIANLNEPRFFHRLLAIPGEGLIVVGGSSMATGKATSCEFFPQNLLQPLPQVAKQ